MMEITTIEKIMIETAMGNTMIEYTLRAKLKEYKDRGHVDRNSDGEFNDREHRIKMSGNATIKHMVIEAMMEYTMMENTVIETVMDGTALQNLVIGLVRFVPEIDDHPGVQSEEIREIKISRDKVLEKLERLISSKSVGSDVTTPWGSNEKVTEIMDLLTMIFQNSLFRNDPTWLDVGKCYTAFQKRRKRENKKLQVPELKFQVNDAEEQNSWLKSLNEEIGNANNKEFDQVTVDENNSLDHLTRNRVKINHTRRPPTRHHRKEVASAVSGGMQRLELGVENLTVEDSTNEEQPKENPSNQTNKNRPILMPKIKPSNAKGGDELEKKEIPPEAETGEGPPAEKGEGPPAEEGEGPLAKEGEGPPAEEGEGPPAEKGEGPLAKEGEGPLAEKGEGPLAEEGEEPATEEGERPPAKGGEGPPAKEGEGPPAKEGEGPSAEEGKEEDLSCATETVADCQESEGESDFQAEVSSGVNIMKKQSSETCNSSLNRANLIRVKCASLGDILSESKQHAIRKQVDTSGHLKKRNVEKLEGEIAFELKVTEELLQQAAGEQHLQSNITQDSWSTRSAAHLLNEAVAKWTEADKVLQELKGLKGLCNKSETLTLEERERRKNLLTMYRRSVP
ncbi:pleckstrin homology domain-containing family O member 2-like [Scyliorhinus canicula]|uniref:pleckstrin homology domain-containing family O member 2-like n=1 Tax=Scyliorhinus canicula TaxID=7830 RepID=UPI0018F4DDE5|nr:pleckstrin homology domain-containing family O member 2-like [Scyliorhinus canicula]